jgi:preprotein translocase subunit YajC
MFATVITHFWHCLLLAQAAAQPAAPGTAPAAPEATGDALPRLLFMILITGVLFYFMMLRPQKKKEQSLRDRLSSLKENDRVVTIGGIHGVVTNVQRDAERVTIRVDESTGTKIRVNLTAVARVLTGEDDESSPAATKK